MHSILVKVVSLTSLFLLTFIAGIIPIKLRPTTDENDPNHQLRNRRRKQAISLSTCFAGGAFFASSMLELLPMVRSEFDSLKIETDFPLPEFGICIGFFLILIVEQIIHVMKDKRALVDVDSEAPTSSLVGNDETNKHYGSTILKKHIQDGLKVGGRGESDEESHDGSDDGSQDGSHDGSHDRSHDEPHHEPHDHHHHSHTKHAYRLARNIPHHKHDEITDSSGHHNHDHSTFFNNSHRHQNQRHYLRSYLLLIALSIHALFEGLAVGLFQNIDAMVELLGALIIHKCILAFSIAVNLVQHNFPAIMIAKSAFLFSAMSPIGLGFGILMLTYTSVKLGHILSAVFQATATGTFLYVTFFEIFFHELNSKECHKLLKVLMMILGFSLLTVVQYFDTKVNK